MIVEISSINCDNFAFSSVFNSGRCAPCAGQYRPTIFIYFPKVLLGYFAVERSSRSLFVVGQISSPSVRGRLVYAKVRTLLLIPISVRQQTVCAMCWSVEAYDIFLLSIGGIGVLCGRAVIAQPLRCRSDFFS